MNKNYPEKDKEQNPTDVGRNDCKCQDDPNMSNCESNISIINYGNINIFNCLANPNLSSTPIPNGDKFCIPLTPGHKLKQSLEQKLTLLLKNTQVPSVLAASSIQLIRRFLLGSQPENRLETEVFSTLEKLSPSIQEVMNCVIRKFDTLPSSDRNRLFAPEFSGDEPISPDTLAHHVSEELLKRTSLTAFGDKDCLSQERPGLARHTGAIDPGDDTFTPSICSINNFRTNSFGLTLAEFKPEEFERQCTLQNVNNQPQLNCQVQTEPPSCPGNSVADNSGQKICLRVPEILPGESVTLQGVNFFNVNAKVVITAKPPGTIRREVETHVCGDLTTPLKEVINGLEKIIFDCRVKDLLTFKVPSDLSDGVYQIEVIVPNNTGIGRFSEFKSGPQFIRVLPSPTSTFQIASERLNCPDETDPDWAGSDEVGLKITTVPIAPDLTPGNMIVNDFYFDDVDSGENRDMSRLLFNRNNIGGVSLSIIGFEIDDEDAYKKQIRSFVDAYAEIIKSQWNAIAGTLGTLGGLTATALGLSAAWASAIASAVTFLFDVFVALWAPADLIIEDVLGLTTKDLAALTSPNFPVPPISGFTSAGGIKVKISPLDKNVQYRELREYQSDEESSRYQIILRYNRF